MVRIAGVNIPDQKQIRISLTYIYGIGLSLAQKILKETEIDPQKKSKDLTPDELKKLKDYIEKNLKIEGELRAQQAKDIKRLKDIKCWRGLRHIKGLPVRGQTTRRNSRTIRGNVRRTMSSGKRKPPAPK